MTDLNDPKRERELQEILRRKRALRRFYEDVYARYAACLARCPEEGVAVELGSGGGFVKETIPEMLTTDVIEYPSVDRVVDATRMPFADASVRALCMLNVFHHIPDVGGFLQEAGRVLVPGGRVLLVDQYPSWLSTPVYKYLHDEPFDSKATDWTFPSSGPLTGANGALAWIVFERDRARFEQEHPHLRLDRFEPHTPLVYWLSGGLKSWSLLPGVCYRAAAWSDRMLAKLTSRLCSFVDVELVNASVPSARGKAR